MLINIDSNEIFLNPMKMKVSLRLVNNNVTITDVKITNIIKSN